MKMKMKNLFLGMSFLAIAGLWTGCSNDEVNTPSEGQLISFHVQGGTPNLRTTGTTAAYVNAFVVYGTDNATQAATLPNLFNGVTVARQVGGVFAYSPIKYYAAKLYKIFTLRSLTVKYGMLYSFCCKML